MFFPPNPCCLSAEDGGRMNCKVLLRLCQALSQSFFFPPTSQSNSSSLDPLWSLQQHNFRGCTYYNLTAPSSIIFHHFHQNYFPPFVFSRFSGSFHFTKGYPLPFHSWNFSSYAPLSEIRSIIIVWETSACSSGVSVKPSSCLGRGH